MQIKCRECGRQGHASEQPHERCVMCSGKCPVCGLHQLGAVSPQTELHQFIVVRDASMSLHIAHADIRVMIKETIERLCDDAKLVERGDLVQWGTCIARDEESITQGSCQWLGTFVAALSTLS